MTEVAVRDSAAAGAASLVPYSPAQVDLIKRTVARDATDDELKMFLYQAKRTGLDPLARQIHFTKRKSRDGDARVAIIVAIDGYRLIAERTGLYVGNDKPEYEYDDNGELVSATVTVRKWLFNQPWGFAATAYWDEYVPEGGAGFMWKKMPRLMLAKVAEALALRKAFPADLSGIYTEDEMAQAETDRRPAQNYVDAAPTSLAADVLPPEEAPKPNGNGSRGPLICEECQKLIAAVDRRPKGGQFYSSKDIAEKTKETYGKVLCWDCSQNAHDAFLATQAAMKKQGEPT